MKYRQLCGEERSVVAALRRVGLKPAAIGRELGRHRSTVTRELKRNAARHDGRYRAQGAQERAQARRSRSRRNSRFGRGQWECVEGLLREEWSPEQVSGHLRETKALAISHETIYRHIWRDLRGGGTLHQHLRGARKSCRKRYGRYDSRGRLAGKRMIGERPRSVERRRQTGHWEIDTMMGESPGQNSHCVLTLVERKSGYVMIGKLQARTAAETNRALLSLLARHPGRMRTIPADNGTEFHWYGEVEAQTPVKFYFATPHHSWERGTNENTNGLIRQYLPKGQSMAPLTQSDCDSIAAHLNNRPRKRHGYKTPNQCFLHT